MIKAITALFGGPYALLAKWGVIALLVASFGGWCWFKGNEHGTAKLTEYIGEQAKEGARVVVKQGKVTERVVTKYITVTAKTQATGDTVKKEVQDYAKANAGDCLDPRWRLLHDAAATQSVPDAGAAADGTVGAPGAAEALDTVTGNYAACHRTADRLDALQLWVAEQLKLNPK